METLRPDINDMSNYPSKETMELFLKLGRKLGILDNRQNSQGLPNYKKYNAVVTLAVICEYLSQEGKEEEKERFLAELETQGDMYYKTMGELALKIRGEKGNLSSYSQSMIQSNKKQLDNKKQGDYPYFPLIVEEDFPQRIQNLEPTKMVHEDFEKKLLELNTVQEGANKIEAETYNHPKFSNGNNDPNKIKDLKNKL